MKFVKLLETNQAAYIILTCFAEVYFILSLPEVLGETSEDERFKSQRCLYSTLK